VVDDYRERVCDGWENRLGMDELLADVRTAHQHLLIFKNRALGRVLALDGVIQTTEADAFIYHEMMAHVPILAHGAVRAVMIVGGGDGGLLREVLRHRDVERVVQVEIDPAVIDLCRRYLPGHSEGAFDDPRTRVVIDDGLRFMQRTDQRFDLILTDSTDAQGSAAVLFGQSYYAACKRRLKPDGVLVTQNGVVFLQPEALGSSAAYFRGLFRDWHFFLAAVPTYVGGSMAFGWACDNPEVRRQGLTTLQRRFSDSGIATRYYSPAIHRSAFALPRFLCDAIGKPCD